MNYEDGDYVIKIREERGRRVFDVYERRGAKMWLRWQGLSEAGLRDLPDMI